MEIGKEFDEIINKNILNGISQAMISLHSEMLYLDKEMSKEVIKDAVKRAKKTINCYIDKQEIAFSEIIDET